MRTLLQNQNRNTPRNLKRVKGGVTSDARSTTPPSAQYNAPAPPKPPTSAMTPPTTPSIQGAGTPRPTTAPTTTSTTTPTAPSGGYTAPRPITPPRPNIQLPPAPEIPMGDRLTGATTPKTIQAPSLTEEEIAQREEMADSRRLAEIEAQQRDIQDAQRGPIGPRDPSVSDYATPETYTPEDFADTLAEGATVPAMDTESPMGTDRNRQILQAYRPMVEAGGFADYEEYAEAANAIGDTNVTQSQFTGYKTDKAFQESPYYSVIRNVQESSDRDIDLLRNRLIGQARIDAQRAGYAPGSREYNNMIRNATDVASQESVRIRQAAGEQYTRQLDKYLDKQDMEDRRLEERDYLETQKRDATYRQLFADQPKALVAYNQAMGSGMSPEKAYQSLLGEDGNVKPRYITTATQAEFGDRVERYIQDTGAPLEEARAKIQEEMRIESEQARIGFEQTKRQVEFRDAAYSALGDATDYRELNQGENDQQMFDALGSITKEQLELLKQDPSARTDLEKLGVKLDYNFGEIGLSPGNSVDENMRLSGLEATTARSKRNRGRWKNSQYGVGKGEASIVEIDGQLYVIDDVSRTFDSDFWGRDDIRQKITGINLTTGQSETLWSETQGV